MNDQLETYRTLRETLTDLHLQQAREVPRTVLRQARKKLGIGQIDMDSPEEKELVQALLVTYCLYHYRKNGQTLLQKHFEAHPPAHGSPEAMIHEALPSYRYSLVEPLGPGDENGTACIDSLRGEGFTLMDEGLAETASARIILGVGLLWPSDDFAMSTGAVLPATGDATERIEHTLLKKLGSPLEEIDFDTLSAHQQSDVAAVIMRHCLRDGALARITE